MLTYPLREMYSALQCGCLPSVIGSLSNSVVSDLASRCQSRDGISVGLRMVRPPKLSLLDLEVNVGELKYTAYLIGNCCLASFSILTAFCSAWRKSFFDFLLPVSRITSSNT